MLAEIQKLFAHFKWADTRLLQALTVSASPPAEAVREFAHILGADETWLSRLQGRTPRATIWPTLTVAELQDLNAAIHEGYRDYVAALDDRGLARVVAYTNTAGKSFENSVRDILFHVALHAQYHRGKVNLMLRQAGLEPAPSDYIAFLRGSSAATVPVTTLPPNAR